MELWGSVRDFWVWGEGLFGKIRERSYVGQSRYPLCLDARCCHRYQLLIADR